MKYRKKPVVIEAIQWTGENKQQICEFTNMHLQSSSPPQGFEHDNDILNDAVTLVIPTLEGDHIANRYDWIIRGVKGEFYPCKPDIFEATYEKALNANRPAFN
jgi:hypothetical protein